MGVWICWTKVSDEDFEVVSSMFSQTNVPVDWLKVSNGDVREGAHSSKLRGGHSPGGKLREMYVHMMYRPVLQ